MSSFLEGKTTAENRPVKRFGYLISAIFLVIANVALISNWRSTPWLFLITMYLLTGSLWIPALIRPLYKLFGKYIVKASESDGEKSDQAKFSAN